MTDMAAVQAMEPTNSQESPGEKSDMEESISSICCLKEHERLDVLLSKIPLKAQTKFLTTCDLLLTCIDANSSYIVLGTNIGIIFVFSREESSIQKIKVTTPNHMITSVKLHEGTDHTVAVGVSIGLLCVYCIPSKASMLEKKEIQKFEVKDVHRNYITCLEWSTNGMKLFSGDTKGHIVITEIDFYEDKCSSMVLLIDAGNEIVQLNYAQKVLAVSTLAKSYLVRMDLGGQIVNIGSQSSEKVSGRFGVCFIPGVYKTQDLMVYSARQDCCLWLADVTGDVKSEHSFSFPFSSEVPEIFLHSPKKEVVMEEFQFRTLRIFRDQEVVTWDNSGIVILDPSTNEVVAFQNRFDSVVDIAVVNNSEIFVVQRNSGSRVVRIAFKPDIKLGIAYNKSLLSTLLPPTITKPGEKDNQVSENSTDSIRRSNSANNIINSSNNNSNNVVNNNSGREMFSFIKKSLVNPLKKLDQHMSQDAERVVNADNIPDAKVASASESQEDKNPDDNSTSLALNFLKKSLVIPLKKLDQHINTDTERVIITKNIPEAKILTESKPQAESDPAKSGEDQVGIPQATSIHNDSRVNKEAAIVVNHKTKKHKKKKHKKADHIAPITEHRKDSVKVVEDDATGDIEVEKHKSGDLRNDENNDNSAWEALRRADSLLEKISHGSMMNGENKKSKAGDVVEMVAVKTESSKKRLIDIAMEARGEKIEEGNKTMPQSDVLHEDVATGVSDDSTQLEHSADSANKSLTTETESSIEHDRTHSEIEGGSQNDTTNSESELSIKNRIKTSLDSVDNDRYGMNYVESGIGSSPGSLNDCVERAFESLNIIDKEEKRMENSLDFADGGKVEKKYLDNDSSPPAVTPNSAVQNYVGFFDSVDESPLEDLYGQSVYSVGSADTILGDYKPPAESRSSKPNSSNNSDSKFCATVESVKYQFQNVSPKIDINVWSELKTPTNIYSVSMSDTHIFYTDKTEHIYHLATKENSVSWKKASGKANQISVSPSGQIVWSIYKKVVYAGTKMNSKHPEGMKWVENVRNVDCISVDNKSAWYITQGGSVIVETKLSLEQPISKPKKITCPYKLKYIHSRYGVVWAITERLQLLVRLGVTEDCLEGKEWMLQSRGEPPFMFNHVCVSHDETGWAVDFLGQLWFCPGVSMANPVGCGQWWQVPLTDSLLHDESTRDLIKEVTRKFDPVKFSHIVSTSRGGLITAGVAGIYLALDFKNVFNVCKGSIQGYQWVNGPPSPLPSTSAWKLLCAGASHTNRGFVWAQHVNKDLYAFKQVKGYAKLIDNTHSFICMSANIFTVWGLTSNGRIMTRIGIDDFCPEGTSWQHLDLIQLLINGDVQIVHLSCSWMYVWAVDVDGQVYHRIGAKVDKPNQLNPIWLPIDNFSRIIFTKVFAGPEEWMVWAIDNRRMIYTRKGIRDTLPIGKEWIHITGIQATELTLSRSGVWALTPTGELYYRLNVSKDDICGSQWKKVPGLFTKISASAEDDLWGVTLDGELRQCNTQHVWRTENDKEFFSQGMAMVRSMSVKEELEWELV